MDKGLAFRPKSFPKLMGEGQLLAVRRRWPESRYNFRY